MEKVASPSPGYSSWVPFGSEPSRVGLVGHSFSFHFLVGYLDMPRPPKSSGTSSSLVEGGVKKETSSQRFRAKHTPHAIVFKFKMQENNFLSNMAPISEADRTISGMKLATSEHEFVSRKLKHAELYNRERELYTKHGDSILATDPFAAKRAGSRCGMREYVLAEYEAHGVEGLPRYLHAALSHKTKKDRKAAVVAAISAKMKDFDSELAMTQALHLKFTLGTDMCRLLLKTGRRSLGECAGRFRNKWTIQPDGSQGLLGKLLEATRQHMATLALAD